MISQNILRYHNKFFRYRKKIFDITKHGLNVNLACHLSGHIIRLHGKFKCLFCWVITSHFSLNRMAVCFCYVSWSCSCSSRYHALLLILRLHQFIFRSDLTWNTTRLKGRCSETIQKPGHRVGTVSHYSSVIFNGFQSNLV